MRTQQRSCAVKNAHIHILHPARALILYRPSTVFLRLRTTHTHKQLDATSCCRSATAEGAEGAGARTEHCRDSGGDGDGAHLSVSLLLPVAPVSDARKGGRPRDCEHLNIICTR